MSPPSGPEPTHRPEKGNPTVKRARSIKRSGVCVSVSALWATTTPAHPAISLVRHRGRYASTSAALRSNAPAALKRLLQCSRQEAHRIAQEEQPAFQSVCRFPAARLKGAPGRHPSDRRSCLQHQRRPAPGECGGSLRSRPSCSGESPTFGLRPPARLSPLSAFGSHSPLSPQSCHALCLLLRRGTKHASP